ncbi:MAG TPA: DUF1801 domain-containing protein [Phnomibacter sp.]|nr:DUF1801 domain-containing protein [Phnomibacter sp.]
MTAEVLQYLQGLTTEECLVLTELHQFIHSLHPLLTEGLSRGVPFFYYQGKRVVGYRSTQTHLSFFIMEGQVLQQLGPHLNGFDVSRTVIRFTTQQPLPHTLVKRMVAARLAEIESGLRK